MAPNATPPQANSISGDACILVVEDEFLVRMFVSDELREVGYRVIEASDAEEAIVILESGVPVDLMLSDVRMPGPLDGLGLLAFVKRAYPGLPVIITSGHLHPDSTLDDSGTKFLAKPYHANHLLELVQSELARP